MARKLTVTTIALVLALAGVASAKQYVLKHPRHEHCRVHYVRKVEHVKRHGKWTRETVCAYVKPKPAVSVLPSKTVVAPAVAAAAPVTSAPAIHLHAHLDPSFTQNPENPLDVTYSYSASAEQQFSDAAPEDAPSLPSGVLALYSDGLLACSINVGGETTGGECAVAYEHFGSHSIDAVYSSGEASATTGVEPVSIEPPPVIPTTTTESVNADGCETTTILDGIEHPAVYSCTYTLDASTSPAPTLPRPASPGGAEAFWETGYQISADGTYIGTASPQTFPAPATPACEVVVSHLVVPEREQLIEEGNEAGLIMILTSPDCTLEGERKLIYPYVGQEILTRSLAVEWTALARFADPETTLADPLGWEASQSEAAML